MTKLAASTFFLAALLGACAEEEMCEDGAPPRAVRILVCDTLERCTHQERVRCPCVGHECGQPRACEASGPMTPLVDLGTPTALHVVDGRFTGDEWADAEPLEGVLTDLYLDYVDGRVYLLNDWHTNITGIRPDCYNYFRFSVHETTVEMWVYGDGHVEVSIDGVAASDAGQGAYGFGASPKEPTPHTIYELALTISGDMLSVCCLDPASESTCEVLETEPVAFTLDARGGHVRAGRSIPDDIPRRTAGTSCGDGSGVCADGLVCQPADATGRRCAAPSAPDGGRDGDGGVDGGPLM